MAMYEDQTAEVILLRMLSRIPAKFDKREGSIIWDSTSPASIELQNFYIALDSVLSEVFADTASREYLIKRCAERGITPKGASYLIGKGVFEPAKLDIPLGTRFSLGDYNYTVIKKVSTGVYNLQCETIGSEPNGLTGQLIPIDYVEGLTSAELVEITILGEDEEETESLRARYFASLQAEAFGGNKIDYKTKILTISGVGGVKIYSGSQWNGGGTVKAVIVNSENGVPSFDLVNQVQTEIDPEINSGEGVGIAPIGHFVTVVGAYDTPVNIETVLTYDDNHSWSTVKPKLDDVIDEFFASLNANWQNTDKITIRIAQLESRILTVEGIVDVQETKLNGKEENLTVDKDSIVSRGTINGQ